MALALAAVSLLGHQYRRGVLGGRRDGGRTDEEIVPVWVALEWEYWRDAAEGRRCRREGKMEGGREGGRERGRVLGLNSSEWIERDV